MVVESGDTLWDLAEARLRDASAGAGVEPRAIVDYLEQIVAANPDTIEDPNLIYVGEQFNFPAIGTPPAPPVAEAAAAPPVVEPPPSPPPLRSCSC